MNDLCITRVITVKKMKKKRHGKPSKYQKEILSYLQRGGTIASYEASYGPPEWFPKGHRENISLSTIDAMIDKRLLATTVIEKPGVGKLRYYHIPGRAPT